MKLCFEKNSLRYCLRKSELEQLKHQGVVKETVIFPATEFNYELHISDVEDPIATYVENTEL